MKALVGFGFVMLMALSSQGASASCQALKAELVAMQNAQKQIMTSLVNNHEAFASSLEEYSLILKDSKGTKSTGVSSSMTKSADAFRSRGLKGKQMAQQYHQASSDLLARVAQCL